MPGSSATAELSLATSPLVFPRRESMQVQAERGEVCMGNGRGDSPLPGGTRAQGTGESRARGDPGGVREDVELGRVAFVFIHSFIQQELNGIVSVLELLKAR